MSRLLGKYQEALRTLSRKTGTPFSSLITSFLILHEVTAVIPFATVFFVAKSYSLGPSLIKQSEILLHHGSAVNNPWMNEKLITWTNDGMVWVERIGRRYGIFGLDSNQDANAKPQPAMTGDITNALVAYICTKARIIDLQGFS